MAKTRIMLEDSAMDAILKMANGNAGAIKVCVDILHKGADIDPDDFLGGFGSILFLDTLGIYEDKIWMLFKDICSENLADALGLLRGVQLGFMPRQELTTALSGSYGVMERERIDEILKLVSERLLNFGKALY